MVPELRSLKPCRELAAMHGGTTALLVGTRLSPATARFYERSKSITMRAKNQGEGEGERVPVVAGSLLGLRPTPVSDCGHVDAYHSGRACARDARGQGRAWGVSEKLGRKMGTAASTLVSGDAT